MTNYPRTHEGFVRALDDIKRLASWHPDKKYVLYVDSRMNHLYGITLFDLFDINYVENGTVANIIDATGNFTRI